MSETYSNFTITRHLDAERSRVWRAFHDPQEYAAWFNPGVDGVTTAYARHDLRVGGSIDLTAQFHDGPASRFLANVTDVVENSRLAYAYDMWLDGVHMSTSVTVITLDEPEDGADGTDLTWVEFGAHFDDLDTPEQREAGTFGLITRLADHVSGVGDG